MDEVNHHTHESDIKERGLSDFMDKKEQEEAVVVNEFEKVHLSGEGCDEDNEEKKLGLLRKLNRSNSSSSISVRLKQQEEMGPVHCTFVWLHFCNGLLD